MAANVDRTNKAASSGLLGKSTPAEWVRCLIAAMEHPARVMDKKTVGATIRRLRRAAEMTQADLAAAVGWDRGTIAGIEAGHSLPGRDLVTALAQVFSTSTDQILGREGVPQPATSQNEDEAELLALFRAAPGPGRAAVLATLRALTRAQN